MCPATHIFFQLLTFLRLKIYLEPLVPLFFREFISYSLKKTQKPKNFFFKGQQTNKVLSIIVSETCCLQRCRTKQGLLFHGLSHCTLTHLDSQQAEVAWPSSLLTVKLGKIGVGEVAPHFEIKTDKKMHLQKMLIYCFPVSSLINPITKFGINLVPLKGYISINTIDRKFTVY